MGLFAKGFAPGIMPSSSGSKAGSLPESDRRIQDFLTLSDRSAKRIAAIVDLIMPAVACAIAHADARMGKTQEAPHFQRGGCHWGGGEKLLTVQRRYADLQTAEIIVESAVRP